MSTRRQSHARKTSVSAHDVATIMPSQAPKHLELNPKCDPRVAKSSLLKAKDTHIHLGLNSKHNSGNAQTLRGVLSNFVDAGCANIKLLGP